MSCTECAERAAENWVPELVDEAMTRLLNSLTGALAIAPARAVPVTDRQPLSSDGMLLGYALQAGEDGALVELRDGAGELHLPIPLGVDHGGAVAWFGPAGVRIRDGLTVTTTAGVVGGSLFLGEAR